MTTYLETAGNSERFGGGKLTFSDATNTALLHCGISAILVSFTNVATY